MVTSFTSDRRTHLLDNVMSSHIEIEVAHVDSYLTKRGANADPMHSGRTPYHQDTLLPRHLTTKTPGPHPTRTPYHQDPIPPGHLTTRTPYHQDTLPPGHFTTRTPRLVCKKAVRYLQRPFLQQVLHTNVLFVGWLFAFSPSNAPVYLRDGDKRKEGNMKALCETAVSLSSPSLFPVTTT